MLTDAEVPANLPEAEQALMIIAKGLARAASDMIRQQVAEATAPGVVRLVQEYANIIQQQAQRIAALEKALKWALTQVEKFWRYECLSDKTYCRYCSAYADGEVDGTMIQHAPDCRAAEVMRLLKEAGPMREMTDEEVLAQFAGPMRDLVDAVLDGFPLRRDEGEQIVRDLAETRKALADFVEAVSDYDGPHPCAVYDACHAAQRLLKGEPVLNDE